MTRVYPEQHTRKQQAHQRLQSRTPKCAICGEADWRCLEKDHLAGRKFTEELIVLCANCHKKRTDSQKDQPPTVSGPITEQERKGRTVLGVVEHARQLCDLLEPLARELIHEGQITSQENENDAPSKPE